MDHENHINTKHNSMAFATTEKPHPISKVVGSDIGKILKFEEVLAKQFENRIENFWKHLFLQSKKTIVYLDSELYLDFVFQYWKSIFTSTGIEFYFNLYNLYRIDYELKLYSAFDRADNFLETYKNLYPVLTKNDFSARFERVETIPFLKMKDKDFVSFEYLMANFFLNQENRYRKPFLDRVLEQSWQRWCDDVADLKADLIKGYLNLPEYFPELNQVDLMSLPPEAVIRGHASLSWIFDSGISPENRNYIVATYPPEFFPKIQSIIDKATGVSVKLKGVEWNDVDVFNQASETKYVYEGNAEALVLMDAKRQFGSSLIGESMFDKTNHFLINYIYSCYNLNKTQELQGFQLS